MAIKWYASGGKRYYVIGTTGFLIDPSTESSSHSRKPPPTAYSVLDRDWIHREMATFSPTGGALTTARCKQLAEELAYRLNQLEAGVA